MKTIITLNMQEKRYGKGDSQRPLLKGFSLSVDEGEAIAVVGESGVGKTTLLNILGLLDRDFAGTYRLWDEDVQALPEKTLAQWRNERIGFVLQESALIHSLTIEENIKLPFVYARTHDEEARAERFQKIVNVLGIEPILGKKPLECSGGEKARAVFARALVMNPPLILSDEPTASLDQENKERLMAYLLKLNREFGATLITATHDLDVASQHDRIISLEKE